MGANIYLIIRPTWYQRRRSSVVEQLLPPLSTFQSGTRIVATFSCRSTIPSKVSRATTNVPGVLHSASERVSWGGRRRAQVRILTLPINQLFFFFIFFFKLYLHPFCGGNESHAL